MTATFKNLSPGAPLKKGDVMRVGFAQEHAYLALDASFATDFNSLWSKMFNVGGYAYPITRNAVTKGQTTAVVDFRISCDGASAADLVNVLDNVTGFYVEVTSVERLNSSQAAQAASPTGAVERETARQEEITQRADESLTNKIAKATGTALNVTKWLSVAIIVVALLVALAYAGKLRKELARA